VKLKIVVPKTRLGSVVHWLLFVVGIVCLGIYFSSYLYRTAYQIYEGWKFDRELEESSPAKAEPKLPEKPVALPSILPDPDRGSVSPVSIRETIIGRLSIQRLHLSAIVEEGVDSATLSRAIGHIPGTAFPGERGNIGIAGHRDTFLRALRDLRPKDQIDFTTRSGRFHYTVDSLTVVDPADISVLKSTGRQALTIVTCFPFNYLGNAPRRYIVHALSVP
jgi:sortase A